MTDIADIRDLAAGSTRLPDTRKGLHIFADGCYAPDSGHGGWAFVIYRDGVEIASGLGGVPDSANNAMELVALLEAVSWVGDSVPGEPVVIWSDSLYAVKGCNSARHIWKNNGWKKQAPGSRTRNRTIANADLWKALDLQLSLNPLVTIDWCKGHSGIAGNERADELADTGRLSIASARHA